MSLSRDYLWTISPLIISAPLGGFALHALACEVSNSGGLGFIGSASSMSQLEEELVLAEQKLSTSYLAPSDALPIGVGFLLFAQNLEEAAKVMEAHTPAAIWLFASNSNADYQTWTQRMRAVSPKSKIWIQTSSVSSAVEIASTSHPDVLVLQGYDAGGHGYQKSAGIISLVPETIDALSAAGLGDIKIAASGGIADGRGAAAAITLGAQGVVLGTRFLAAKEVTLPAEGYRDGILRTRDGGQTTVRDKVFDNLRGPNRWPVEYDGRSVVVDSYVDLKEGMAIDEIRRLHAQAEKGTEKGFGFKKGEARAAIWAGTGVGLVNKVQGAREIVEDIREGTRKAIESAKARM